MTATATETTDAGRRISGCQIAVLRIELSGTVPAVWRRVAVAAATDLETLHAIVQAAMGWRDNHLWEFIIDGKRYGIPEPEDRDSGRCVSPAEIARLTRFLAVGIDRFEYVYDMGDNWRHRIVIEGIEHAEAGAVYPDLRAGKRRCPPEDCGGVPGYYGFLEIIAAPDKGPGSRLKRRTLAWYAGGVYDPENIGEEEIRAALARIGAADGGAPKRCPRWRRL